MKRIAELSFVNEKGYKEAIRLRGEFTADLKGVKEDLTEDLVNYALPF
jgi:hypothetical protein